MIVVVGASGLLVEGLLVVIVAAKYRLVLLAELGGLLLQLGHVALKRSQVVLQLADVPPKSLVLLHDLPLGSEETVT
jgi:hypothetical protein